MAPFIQESSIESHIDTLPVKSLKLQTSLPAPKYYPGRAGEPVSYDNYEYEQLRPRFPDVHWEPYFESPHTDKGLLGDENFSNLLSSATDVFDYTPKIGTEISGVRLSQLTDAQKNDLARLIATRGVVFFRNQDDFDINAQRELGQYFGTLHKHATTAVPRQEGLEDVHVVYAGEDSKEMRAVFTPTFLWHSDVSFLITFFLDGGSNIAQVTYEIQPPSYTSLKLLTGPPRGGGGDTVWSSQYAAYDSLSAPMQRYLEGLTALHSSHMQAEGSRAIGRPVRRDPIITEHPLVRVHPVTKWKSLFFNPGFVTKIVGIPKIESDHIIGLLNEIVATTNEMHVRFQLGKNDVAYWDNRICNHSATYGFMPHRRHAVRVAVMAERPYFDSEGRSQEEELNERFGLAKVNKDGSGFQNYND